MQKLGNGYSSKRDCGNKEGGLLVAPRLTGPPLVRRQRLPTKALDKGLRGFRLGEAEHHELPAIAALQGVRERWRRWDSGSAKYHLAVLYSLGPALHRCGRGARRDACAGVLVLSLKRAYADR
jgi:hypothetical protein